MRAFAVYECDEGWCIEPLDHSLGTLKTGPERKRIAAFSKLSQAMWWLPRNLDAWKRLPATTEEAPMLGPNSPIYTTTPPSPDRPAPEGGK